MNTGLACQQDGPNGSVFHTSQGIEGIRSFLSILSLKWSDIPLWSMLLTKSTIVSTSRGVMGWRMERATTFHYVSAQTFAQVTWDTHHAVWKSWESFGREGGQAAISLHCLSIASFALAIMEYKRILIWSRLSFERLLKGVIRSSWTARVTQSCIL